MLSIRGLGVGSREVEKLCESLGCNEPFELRTEVELALDDRDMPELYDLRFGSGVVLEEEGVTLFRGINEGDCADDRGRGPGSSLVGGVLGAGGA